MLNTILVHFTHSTISTIPTLNLLNHSLLQNNTDSFFILSDKCQHLLEPILPLQPEIVF